MNNPKILAIETSCDETAAAVLFGPKIKSSIVYSQLKLHQKTKGIVPEVASRAHIEKIIPVIKEALFEAKASLKEIDIIAVTVGPGLIGSLLVGVDTAKTLAYIFKKPIIPINHIEGHIYANFICHSEPRTISRKCYVAKNLCHSVLPSRLGGLAETDDTESIINRSRIECGMTRRNSFFPAIALVVSGGHTSLILMRGHENYKILGSTVDDAAGEAFDKVAKILGLPYPGGPAVAEAASRKQKAGSWKPALPRPMIDSGDFNFSFSGLKTAVLYKVKKLPADSRQPTATIAAEFQQAVVDVLVSKTIKAARAYNAKSIMLGGGVAANKLLRQQLGSAVKKELPAVCCQLPAALLCTDNAAMIGLCAYYKYQNNKKSLKNWREIKINLNPEL